MSREVAENVRGRALEILISTVRRPELASQTARAPATPTVHYVIHHI